MYPQFLNIFTGLKLSDDSIWIFFSHTKQFILVNLLGTSQAISVKSFITSHHTWSPFKSISSQNTITYIFPSSTLLSLFIFYTKKMYSLPLSLDFSTLVALLPAWPHGRISPVMTWLWTHLSPFLFIVILLVTVSDNEQALICFTGT